MSQLKLRSSELWQGCSAVGVPILGGLEVWGYWGFPPFISILQPVVS